MITFIIATKNDHKVREIGNMLGTHFNCVSLRDFPGAPDIVEDAPDFRGNATKKAVGIARWLSATHPGQTGAYVLADDSGLEVDALDGAPGVHSARFAALDTGRKGNSSTAENNAKLLRLLKHVPAEKRTARFHCVIAICPVTPRFEQASSPVCYADEQELATRLFEGTCEGRIAFGPSGHGGFGYDPLFIPDGYTESFAELGESVKNRVSHRAKALGNVRQALA